MMVRFLTLKGACVVPAPDAFEGIKAVKECRPDVLLSDISLPNRDGFQFLGDIPCAWSREWRLRTGYRNDCLGADS